MGDEFFNRYAQAGFSTLLVAPIHQDQSSKAFGVQAAGGFADKRSHRVRHQLSLVNVTIIHELNEPIDLAFE